MIADATGNTYVAGTFSSGAKFGGQSLEPSVGIDLLLMRLDPAGKLVWAKDVEPGAPELHPVRLQFDPAGNLLLLAGIPGDGGLSDSLEQMLLAKFDTAGNSIWSRKVKSGLLASVHWTRAARRSTTRGKPTMLRGSYSQFFLRVQIPDSFACANPDFFRSRGFAWRAEL